MRCPACNAVNQPGSSYCESCGSRFALVCPKCASEHATTARFCSNCGFEIALGLPSLIGGAITDAERKQVTVLFADIVGSTALISGLDAEQAMDRLRPALTAMCEPVERFKGAVASMMGDGIMALFGVPHVQEGHALLAAQAALAIQRAFSQGAGRPMVRIGLHSGEVVSGALYSPITKETAVHGITVHMANRVQQLADAGDICITEDCYRLVRSYCETSSMGLQAIRGIGEPVQVYRLRGLKPAVASQQFRGTALTPFCNRDHEFDVLRRALRRAENGDARVIGISAPPGTGKSRLCYQFAEWCRNRQIPVMEARAVIYGHATPLQPVLELFRVFFRIAPTEEKTITRSRVAQRLLPLDAAFEADLPVLYDFLGVADADAPPLRLDPKARQARLRQTLQRIVQRASAATSVLILEDLHWLDEASDDFIETLVDAIGGTRGVLVVNYRPSYAAPWMKRPHFREIQLEQLKTAHIGEIVSQLMGDDPALSDMRKKVSERSGGNPFFAEELIRSLVDSGAVVGEPGKHRLGQTGGGGALPSNVQAVIGARVDRLGEAAKSVLQVGAIIGKDFPLIVLEQVMGATAFNLREVLSRLCEAQLIQEQVESEHHRFAFHHPLIQEAVYAAQLKSRRAVLHAAVAKAMEAFHADRLDEFAGLIAHHHEAAGQHLQAAHHWARAAMWVGKTNSAQGLQHWKKVRSLLQDAPSSKPGDALRALSCGQVMNFGWREGMTPDEARPYAEEARRLAREGGDLNLLTHILAAFGRVCAATGSADEYASSIKEGLSLLSAQTRPGRHATLNATLSQAYTFAGLLDDALAANTIALENSHHIEADDYQILGFNLDHWIKCLRGKILVLLGRIDEAEAWLRTTLQMERGQIDPVVHYIPHAALVDLAWWRRDAALAQRHASRVSEIAELSAIPYLRVYALACTGVAKTVAGEFEAAVRDLDRALDFARQSKVGLEYEARMLADLAECHWYAGDPIQAMAMAREAIDIAQRRTARCAECHASIISASILAADAEGNDEAEILFRRAADLIEMCGARIYEPLLKRGRAQLLTVAR